MAYFTIILDSKQTVIRGRCATWIFAFVFTVGAFRFIASGGSIQSKARGTGHAFSKMAKVLNLVQGTTMMANDHVGRMPRVLRKQVSRPKVKLFLTGWTGMLLDPEKVFDGGM